jgi:hypothetical protein
MDLDYCTLSNAGLWCIGRLSTDADRARVIDGLSIGRDDALANTIKRLSPRWFVVRDVQAGEGPVLLQLLARTTSLRPWRRRRGDRQTRPHEDRKRAPPWTVAVENEGGRSLHSAIHRRSRIDLHFDHALDKRQRRALASIDRCQTSEFQGE